RGCAAVVPNRIQTHGRRGPGEPPRVGRVGDHGDEREQLQHRHRLASRARGQGERAVQQPSPERAEHRDDVTGQHAEHLPRVGREQEVAAGQHVFKEGGPGNRLFIISEGDVRISRTIPGTGEEALAVLKPGASFGEMAIFDRSERSTDAIANTSCTLLTISRSDFELLLDFNRDIAYKVLWSVVRLLSARLRVTNDNLRSFLAMSMF